MTPTMPNEFSSSINEMVEQAYWSPAAATDIGSFSFIVEAFDLLIVLGMQWEM